MAMYDRKKMKEDLLRRAKIGYERREGDANTKYFDPDAKAKYWRCQPTKEQPHIVDIIPWLAGKNYPTKTKDVSSGDWTHVLDLYVHPNVGPSKKMVVCPNLNYGDPCPICDEVRRLQDEEGLDWMSIPFAPSRRCSYNVIVMDNQSTEAEGIQIWEVSHGYSEKVIESLAKSPRGGGYQAFSCPDRDGGGVSIAFDVANDTYKKISGHKFVNRDYDIPDDILSKAHTLDEMIVVYDEETLRTMLEATKRVEERKAEAEQAKEEKKTEESHSTGTTTRGSSKPAEAEGNECPVGAAFGADFGRYGDCDDCEKNQQCAEAADRADVAGKTPEPPARQESRSSAPPAAEPVAEQAPPAARRTLARRNAG